MKALMLSILTLCAVALTTCAVALTYQTIKGNGILIDTTAISVTTHKGESYVPFE